MAQPRTWQQIASDPEFQKLNLSEQREVRDQFFTDVMAPAIPEDSHQEAYNDLYTVAGLPEDSSYGEIIQKGVENAPAGFTGALAGAARGIIEQGDADNYLNEKAQLAAERSALANERTTGYADRILNLADAVGNKFSNDITDLQYGTTALPSVAARNVWDDPASTLATVQNEANAQVQENQAIVGDPTSFKGIMNVTAQSLPQQVPGLLATVATKNPGYMLGMGAVLADGQAYGEQRAAGQDPYSAGRAAAGYGAAEAIGEKLPITQLLKTDVGYAMKLGRTMIADSLGEAATQAIQSGIDKGTIRPDMTLGEAMEQVGIAAGAGALSAGAYTTALHPITKIGNPPATVADNATVPPQATTEENSAVQTPEPQPGTAASSNLPEVDLPQLSPEAAAVYPWKEDSSAPAASPEPLSSVDVPQIPEPAADAGVIQPSPAPASPPPGELDEILANPDVPVADIIRKNDLKNALPGEQEIESDYGEGTEGAGRVFYNPETGAIRLPDQEPVGMNAAGQRVSVPVKSVDDIVAAGAQAASSPLNKLPEPTQPQKEAGNYKKGHVRIHGMEIAIETPRGGKRSGTDANGKPWEVTLPFDYGYVKRTTGADGEQVDTFIGNDPKSETVYVVDQMEPETGKFDEHKALIGFSSPEEARSAYEQAFSDGSAAQRIQGFTAMPVSEFKAWLKGDKTAAPIAKKVKPKKDGKPVDLLRFIAQNGGVRDENGELKSIGAQRFIPGHGALVRQGGKSKPIDEMREAAVEAGYGNFETTADFLDAIDQSVRGTPIYSNPDIGKVLQKQEEAHDPDYDAYLRERAEMEAEINQRATDLGISVENRTLDDIMADIHEREAIQATEAEAEARADQIEAEIDRYIANELEIPWEITATKQPASGASVAETGQSVEAEGQKGAGQPDPVAESGGQPSPEITETGGQSVIPGAERISDRELAERKMEGRKKASVPQQDANDGLFYMGARAQTDLLSSNQGGSNAANQNRDDAAANGEGTPPKPTPQQLRKQRAAERAVHTGNAGESTETGNATPSPAPAANVSKRMAASDGLGKGAVSAKAAGNPGSGGTVRADQNSVSTAGEGTEGQSGTAGQGTGQDNDGRGVHRDGKRAGSVQSGDRYAGIDLPDPATASLRQLYNLRKRTEKEFSADAGLAADSPDRLSDEQFAGLEQYARDVEDAIAQREAAGEKVITSKTASKKAEKTDTAEYQDIEGGKFQRRTKDDERELIVQHNLTLAKLLHANRIGGIPVPSLAITKKSTPMDKFGEITLIAHKNMVDPKISTRNKVFGADAYSPRYPEVNYQIDYKPYQEYFNSLRDIQKRITADERDHSYLVPTEDDISRKGVTALENSGAVAAKYLDDHNIAWPEPERYSDGRFSPSGYARRLVETAIKQDGYFDYIAEVARKMIKSERIFNGFTYAGNRRYLPHNLETVVKIMTKKLRDGEGYNYGVGSIRAKFTKQFRTIEQIRQNKDKIVDEATFDRLRKEVDEEFFALAEKWEKHSDFGSSRFGWLDIFSEHLKEAASRGVGFINREYYKGTAPDELMNETAGFMRKLADFPTEYFEAKIQRAVQLNEFEGAILPHGAEYDKAAEILKRKGISRIMRYEKNDETARSAAIASFDDLMFQKNGGKGADTAAENMRVMPIKTEEWTEQRQKIATAAMDAFKETYGADRLRFVDHILDQKGNRQTGAFSPYTGLVYVAMNETPRGRRGTIGHEGIHLLRYLDVFTDQEWNTLADMAKKKWIDQFNIRKNYAQDAAGKTPEEAENLFIEEAIAEAQARFAEQSRFVHTINRIFHKLAKFIARLKNGLRDSGIRTADDILADVRTGKYAEKAAEAVKSENTAEGDEKFQRTDENFVSLRQPDIGIFDVLRNQNLSLMEKVRNAASKEAIVTSADEARRKLQDRFLPWLRVQDAIERQTGRKINEAEDVYHTEETFTGRTGYKLDRLNSDYLDPLLDDIADFRKKITTGAIDGLDIIEDYLYALHAPERNAQIQKINPKFAAEGGGSGMTDAEAAAIIAKAKEDGHVQDLDAIAERVQEILKNALKERFDMGLINKETYNTLKSAYKHYVPLRGHVEVGVEPGNNGGKGVSLRGEEMQRALGRRSKARDLMANIFGIAQESIVRGEKARVGQSVLELVKKNPDKDLWEIDKMVSKPVLNRATGLVEYRMQPHPAGYKPNDDTIFVKKDGETFRVTIHDPRLAASMLNLETQNADMLIRALMNLNRFLSAMNTTFDPQFVITNGIRDIQTAMINVQQYNVKGLAKAIRRDYLKALNGAWRGLRDKEGKEWDKYYREYAAAGGKVSFFSLDNLDNRRRKLMKEINIRNSTTGAMTHRAARATIQFIEDANMAVDNGLRLSAYVNARRAGMTQQQAAVLAKNLTVNFNKRGELGPKINALYLFANASIQGSVVVLKAIRHSRKVQAIVGASIALGFGEDMLNAFLSPDDDDGEKKYDKIPEWEKEANFIIMDPSGKLSEYTRKMFGLGAEGGAEYIKIPKFYGYRVFPEIGRNIAKTARGAQKPTTAAKNIALSIVNNFNPIGNGGSLLNVLAPTFLDPVVDLLRNEDWSGRKIMPDENPYDKSPDPQSQRSFPSTTRLSREVAEGLNRITGGDEFRSGAIDVSPAAMDYLFGQFTGAAGGFASKTVDVVNKGWHGEDLQLNQIPFARKVLGETATWQDKNLAYDRMGEVYAAYDRYSTLMKSGQNDRADRAMKEDGALIDLYAQAKSTTKELRAIRKEKISVQNDGRLKDDTKKARVKELEEQERNLVNRFNSSFLKATKPQNK